MPKLHTKRISRAPKLPDGDPYYTAWNVYDSSDEVLLERPEPVVKEDPTFEIVRPLLKKYGYLNQCEIDLLEALWAVFHIQNGGASYAQFLAHANIISPFAANILDSPACDVCNLNCIFHKLYNDGWLRIPGIIQCFLAARD